MSKRAKKQPDLEVCIGYDDHTSVYKVPRSSIAKLLKLKKSADANDFLVDNGKYVEANTSDVFLDLEGDRKLKEFHNQLHEYLELNA